MIPAPHARPTPLPPAALPAWRGLLRMNRRAAPHRGLDAHYGGESAEPEAETRPSKSQLKRESHSLQELGAELVELSDERL